MASIRMRRKYPHHMGQRASSLNALHNNDAVNYFYETLVRALLLFQKELLQSQSVRRRKSELACCSAAEQLLHYWQASVFIILLAVSNIVNLEWKWGLYFYWLWSIMVELWSNIWSKMFRHHIFANSFYNIWPLVFYFEFNDQSKFLQKSAGTKNSSG